MPARQKTSTEGPGAEPSARDRILDAAIRRFARQSYDQTTLREIAADAEADVAYVHRSFGGKTGLFEAALEEASRENRSGLESLMTAEPEDAFDILVSEFLERLQHDVPPQIRPIDLTIHSLSSPEANRIIRERLARDFINPLKDKFAEGDKDRAVLLTSFFAGLQLFQTLFELRNIMEKDQEHLEAMITETIGAIMSPLKLSNVPPEEASG